MTVWYLPLERYRERYTDHLEAWTVSRLASRGVDCAVIGGGDAGTRTIATGPVLDAHRRSAYALAQTAELIGAIEDGRVADGDAIYLADMFQPGYEAIPYCLAQGGPQARIVAHCWAQSVDPNDFTFPMRAWMRSYERMVDRTASALFVASTALEEMLRAALFAAPIVVAGLPFSAEAVRRRAGPVPPLSDRPRRIIYASRLDREKQPHFFLDLAEDAADDPVLGGYRFAIASGSPALRSNDPTVLRRVAALEAEGLLDVHVGLEKERYYGLLAESRVQFNCALQDFVSYTMLEASALGTPTLAPAHLAFPEALRNDERFLYAPWSPADAREKLRRLVGLIESSGVDPAAVGRPSAYHDAALDRVIDAILGLGAGGERR